MLSIWANFNHVFEVFQGLSFAFLLKGRDTLGLRFPFKVDNQDIWHNHVNNFYFMYLCVAVIYTVSFKTGLQTRATVPSIKQKKLCRGVAFTANASACLCKYGGCKKDYISRICNHGKNIWDKFQFSCEILYYGKILISIF